MTNKPIVLDINGTTAAAMGLRYILDGHFTSPQDTLDLIVTATQALQIKPRDKDSGPAYLAPTVSINYFCVTPTTYQVVVTGPDGEVVLNANQYLDPDQWVVFFGAAQNLLVLGVLDDDYNLIPSVGLIVVPTKNLSCS